MMFNLGVNMNPKGVIEKFDAAFGNVLPSEMLLEIFYTARQDRETITV